MNGCDSPWNECRLIGRARIKLIQSFLGNIVMFLRELMSLLFDCGLDLGDNKKCSGFPSILIPGWGGLGRASQSASSQQAISQQPAVSLQPTSSEPASQPVSSRMFIFPVLISGFYSSRWISVFTLRVFHGFISHQDSGQGFKLRFPSFKIQTKIQVRVSSCNFQV